jgi:hypothetical protein
MGKNLMKIYVRDVARHLLLHLAQNDPKAFEETRNAIEIIDEKSLSIPYPHGNGHLTIEVVSMMGSKPQAIISGVIQSKSSCIEEECISLRSDLPEAVYEAQKELVCRGNLPVKELADIDVLKERYVQRIHRFGPNEKTVIYTMTQGTLVEWKAFLRQAKTNAAVAP